VNNQAAGGISDDDELLCSARIRAVPEIISPVIVSGKKTTPITAMALTEKIWAKRISQRLRGATKQSQVSILACLIAISPADAHCLSLALNL
jgi:hypothetical protein